MHLPTCPSRSGNPERSTRGRNPSREGEYPKTASKTAGNVGVEISAGPAHIAYVPGAAAVTAAMMEQLARADVVFFDGTLFHDDEMILSGAGTKPPRTL